MVGIGFLMLAIGLTSLWLRRQGELYHNEWFHRCCVFMAPAVCCNHQWVGHDRSGASAFTVYGLLRTADSISPVDAAAVSVSLAAFVVVYFSVFGAGFFYLLRLMRKSPTKYAQIQSSYSTVSSNTDSNL